jgi:predicted transcriptional regulator
VDDKDLEFFEKVVVEYRKKKSIKDTAVNLELSRTKVRKILITMGEITSSITDEATRLLKQGKTQNEVAEILNLSTATLSTYLPYGNRIYNRDEKSAGAIRVEECRARQAIAADGQIRKNREENKDEIGNEINTQEAGIMNNVKVRLTLNINDADMEILKDKGKVKDGIIREVSVPENATLYALHYMIQKMFGWQNSHLHHFELTHETFDSLVGDDYKKWCELCGVVFRFPYDSSEEILEDIYWDDDYQEGQSFKTWLKKKYNPPYYYGGTWELEENSKELIEVFKANNKELVIGPSFEEYLNGETGRKKIRYENLTYSNLKNYFEGGMDEILERLTVAEVLRQFGELIYEYDYGDGWEVRVEYKGECIGEAKPVCTYVDGLAVMDDVGGIHGYCAFLAGENQYENIEESRDWARFMGWTGRMSKPENML